MRASPAGLGALVVALCVALHPTPARLATTPTPAELLKRAAQEFDAFHYATAESLAVVARDRLEHDAAPDMVLLGDAYLTIGQSRVENGDLGDTVAHHSLVHALELYRSKLPDDDLKVADAHNELGFLLNQTRRSAEALPHELRALEITRAKRGESSLFTATKWFNLGTTYRRLGQLDSALVAFRHHMIIHEQAHQPKDDALGIGQVEIANVLELQGNVDGAREWYERGLHTLEAMLDPTHPRIGFALNRYAGFAYRTGDYAQCVDLMQRAVAQSAARLGPEAHDTQLYWANIAQALGDIGDYPRVLQILARVLPQFEKTYGPTHAYVTGMKESRAYALAATGDTLGALAQFRDVQSVLEADTTASVSGDLTACLYGQAVLLEASGDLHGALKLADRALRTERARPSPMGRDLASILTLQVADHARLGEWAQSDSADVALRSVVEQYELVNAKDYDVLQSTRSAVAARRGRFDEALQLAEEAAHWSRRLLLRNVQALSDRQALILAGTLSTPLQRLLQVATEPGAPARAASIAWDDLVRSRGLVRAEIARRRPPAISSTGAPVDTALASAHEAWVRAQRRLAQFEVSIAGEPHDPDSDAHDAELRAGAEEAERRWTKLASVDTQPDAVSPDSVGLEQVRAALPAEAALVSLATVRRWDAPTEQMIAFVAHAGKSRVRVVDLGPVPRLEREVARWLGLLARSPAGDPRAEALAKDQGTRVRALTWDTLAPFLKGAKDVYIVPDDVLSPLPWAALPEGRDAYLVETGPRLHVLNAERELLSAPAAPAEHGLLAVGGVDFDGASGPSSAQPLLIASTRALFVDCGDAALGSLASLPATTAEVEAVARAWSHGRDALVRDVDLLQGGEATEVVFKQQAIGRAVIHLATHGITLTDTCGAAAREAARVTRAEQAVQGERAARAERSRGVGGVEALAPEPANSALHSPWMGRRVLLALADANHARQHDRDENEGLLTAEEVTTLDLRAADWVVLSACQSGLGDSWASDGLLGMRRAFHLAGARTVIASQWSVDDESTREWMTALYEARAAGARTATAAMQQASRAVLKARREAGRSTHPFYWAAFTASGE